jgi:hypothetical protein
MVLLLDSQNVKIQFFLWVNDVQYMFTLAALVPLATSNPLCLVGVEQQRWPLVPHKPLTLDLMETLDRFLQDL